MKAQTVREHMDKPDLIKIKNMCASKDAINFGKAHPTGGRTCLQITCDKNLLSRIYKELLQLKKTVYPVPKRQKI